MDKLIRDGRVIRGHIGIGGREITLMHTPQDDALDQVQQHGILVVNEVSPSGPAAQAGIQVNDVILASTINPPSPQHRKRWIKLQKAAVTARISRL